MLQTLTALDVGKSSPQIVLIAAGTPIICELGHAVCVTASDLRPSESLAIEMFTRWQHGNPHAGDLALLADDDPISPSTCSKPRPMILSP